MQDLDIVYFVKNSTTNEELRYSLRSICKNLNFRRVVIFGSVPDGIEPDVFIRVNQEGRNKWDRVKNMLIQACRNPGVSDNFILMNDDFFVMSPMDELPVYHGESLYELIINIEIENGNTITPYTKELRKTLAYLKTHGYPVVNYELHIPIVINKQRMLDIIDQFADYHATRTLYGNLYRIGGEKHADVKVVNMDDCGKGSPLLSTSDESFSLGKVGEYIRTQFNEPCKYEERKKL